jgi:hypothetical protein
MGWKLPIQLFYNGPSDLDNDMIDIFKNEEGVSVVDVSRFLPVMLNNSIKAWGIKPFAMLMSTFQEFIFIDADGNLYFSLSRSSLFSGSWGFV